MNRINLPLNETLEIELPGRGTAGYEWTCKPEKEDILRVAHKYLVSENALAGGTGLERFSLTGTKRGTCRVLFEQIRSWEKDTKPLDTKDYEITVV